MAARALADGREHTRRRALVVAAEECFSTYGVRRTTMDDVARRAGVSRPTLYRHFTDRDALVVEVITRRSRAFSGRAHAYIDGRPTFVSKVVDGLAFLVEGGRGDPILRAVLQPGDLGLSGRAVSATAVAHTLTMEIWEPVLTRAKADGELRADIDVVEMCRLIADIQLVVVGRDDLIEPSGLSVRDLVRSFLLPALIPS